MKFATAYNAQSQERSKVFATKNNMPTMTQRSDKDSTDINFIVKQFTKTGQLPQTQMEALYGDFSDVGDYRTALERLQAAKDAFQALPAATRKHFNNDPGYFLDYAQNPDNIEELRKLGLANPKLEPETPPTPTPAPTKE